MKSEIFGLLVLVLFISGCTSGEIQGATENEPISPPVPPVPENIQESGITSLQLSNHNTENDCWVAYKGSVYDITNWIPKHPGGENALIPLCGTSEEFEQAFSGQHGTSQVEKLKKEGILKGNLE